MIAVLESDRHGDHDVKADGCEEESAASMMSFSRVFNAVYDLVWGATSSLKVSAMRHTYTSDDVVREAEMTCLRLSHIRQHVAGILTVALQERVNVRRGVRELFGTGAGSQPCSNGKVRQVYCPFSQSGMGIFCFCFGKSRPYLSWLA